MFEINEIYVYKIETFDDALRFDICLKFPNTTILKNFYFEHCLIYDEGKKISKYRMKEINERFDNNTSNYFTLIFLEDLDFRIGNIINMVRTNDYAGLKEINSEYDSMKTVLQFLSNLEYKELKCDT